MRHGERFSLVLSRRAHILLFISKTSCILNKYHNNRVKVLHFITLQKREGEKSNYMHWNLMFAISFDRSVFHAFLWENVF